MKNTRHNAIRDLLVRTTVADSGSISNQDDLRRKLAAKGIHVTQATLSRDIRELKLLKGPAGYALPNDPDSEEELPDVHQMFQNFGLEVRQAQNLLVVITLMGGAQPVAAGIDAADWREVVGTVAGENTVLIICPDNRTAATLKDRIEEHLA